MTVGEYIKEQLSAWSVSFSDAFIEIELARLGMTASETITGESNTDQFFYNVIPTILSAPSSISEGGYSISYDKASMISVYSMLAKRLGKKDILSGNSITDITNRW